MPLNDRDYMRSSPPGGRRFRRPDGFTLNPLLVLITINLVFFIATSINSNLKFDLAFVVELIGERPWSVISSIFIHDGFAHFLFNMIALFFFGRTLKAYVGENRFLLVYFTGGIIGNLAFWLFSLGDSSFLHIVLGASGAIYALAGALVVMVPRMRIFFWGIIPMPLWVFTVVFLVILSLPWVVSSSVAWQAHFGGLVIGLIFGFFFRRKFRAFFY